MKPDSVYLALSSLAALAGAAIGAYQILSPSAGKTPVEVSVRLDDAKTKGEIGLSDTSFADNKGKQQHADSGILLRNLRASLAMIATGYGTEGITAVSHRSSGLVVKSAGEAAHSIEELEVALRSGQPSTIAAATANASRSIAKLKSAYALVPERNERVSAGMRGVVANWTAYAARYILSSPPVTMKSVDPARVRALKQEVSRLSQRVALLEKQTAQNQALSREVLRVRTELVYFENRADDYRSYQAMLLTLSMVSGAFDAFLIVTHDYYPRYYSDFEPCHSEIRFWEAYWTGYYDGYYARDRIWYHEAFAVPDQVILVPTADIAVYQQISYQQIIQISAQSSVALDRLPAEDLSDVDVPPAPEEISISSDTLVELSRELAPVSSTETAAAQGQERQSIDDELVTPGRESEPAPEATELQGAEASHTAQAQTEEAPESSTSGTPDMEEPQSLGSEAGQTEDDASMEPEASPSVEEPAATHELR